MPAKNNPETSTHTLVVGREFEAPRDLVWKAWSDPAQVKAWLSLGNDFTIESVTMNLCVEGQFRIQTKSGDGEYFTAAGTYLEVKSPERLVYTWDWEKDGAGTAYGELEGKETRVTVEFFELGERTRLKLTHELFASVKSRDSHEGGWTSWLERLTKYLAAQS